MSDRTEAYAAQLGRLIQAETVSAINQKEKVKFTSFQSLLREEFPAIFRACEPEDFDGSLLLRWKGDSDKDPVMLMNHHDVVEAPGNWKYPPFSGTVAEGKIWGRGAVDTKGGLWAMLCAANELASEGFKPRHDVYFFSACNEETSGQGADTVSRILKNRGLRFSMVLDEGGMMIYDPIGGADGTFAMIGLGEKECVELKFIARSRGGHASTPARDTPLVRLGKFMVAAETTNVFEADIPPELYEMFSRLGSKMKQPLKGVLSHPRLFRDTLIRTLPAVSDTAGAMLKTTIAFTMASGSEGTNVLPQEAWVIGDMRCSHHQGSTGSIAAIKELADKFDVDVLVLSRGVSSPISSPKSEAFRLIEKGIKEIAPDVIPCPYLMTGASDCRFMSRISDNCLRFTPFTITTEQLECIHGVNENLDISCLEPAVNFYKYIIKEA
ncbi:MAG: M20/M25/M40 family metallo-hydrolase [Clostridia bacterium]|nr:M20/M25/M40 family metallo-hydrolase [Clostridia bacterium]